MSECFGFMVYQFAISVVVHLSPYLCPEMLGADPFNSLPRPFAAQC
jgi:hypothetical protein